MNERSNDNQQDSKNIENPVGSVLGKDVKVYFNGQRLAVRSFKDYVNLYLGPKEQGAPRVYERVGPRWEVIISPTEGQHQQVCASFSHASGVHTPVRTLP